MIDLYSLIPMHRYDSNSTSNIKADNFLHDSRTQHEISELELMGLTRLIK
jgi:hypothetical protein